mmetsp:Transcript_81471/g.174497  ORF Transcript_81471/g.174497 Transcript_81471/m.174497 type:complete len:269 (+) Transcript_81471:191-997(+)
MGRVSELGGLSRWPEVQIWLPQQGRSVHGNVGRSTGTLPSSKRAVPRPSLSTIRLGRARSSGRCRRPSSTLRGASGALGQPSARGTSRRRRCAATGSSLGSRATSAVVCRRLWGVLAPTQGRARLPATRRDRWRYASAKLRSLCEPCAPSRGMRASPASSGPSARTCSAWTPGPRDAAAGRSRSMQTLAPGSDTTSPRSFSALPGRWRPPQPILRRRFRLWALPPPRFWAPGLSERVCSVRGRHFLVHRGCSSSRPGISASPGEARSA